MYAMAVLQLAQALRMGKCNLRGLFELLLASIDFNIFGCQISTGAPLQQLVGTAGFRTAS